MSVRICAHQNLNDCAISIFCVHDGDDGLRGDYRNRFQPHQHAAAQALVCDHGGDGDAAVDAPECVPRKIIK